MEIKTPEESREVATRTPSTMDIIAQVSAMPPDSGDRVALMERLIKMKYDDEDRTAEKDFHAHFAKMRAELPSIKKSKEVKRAGGGHMYNYAPLEEIQKACDPILQSHDFSYSWREEAIEGGKRVWFDLFGYGHTKANCFDAPLLGAKQSNSGGEIVNAVQGARMTSSYAKRNSMVDGLGLIIEDEDEDGASIEIDAELQTALEKMRKADNLDTLMDVYKIAYTRYEKETNFLKLVVGEYNLDKMALSRKPHA
jgi:hypothetical protein